MRTRAALRSLPMWSDILLGGAIGGAAGVAGALAAECLTLALRRRRNAALAAAGELPFKDDFFRAKWGLLGAAGVVAGALARGLGTSFAVAIAAALALPALLAALGLYFIAREHRR